VTASKFPFPTVCADRSSTDWFSSISRTLKWNERERQKSFVVVEENPEAARADARRDQQAAADDAALDVGDEEDENEEEEGEFDIDFMDDTSSQSSASAPVPVAEPSPGMRQARETMLQPEESALGREKTREDARQPPHSARHVAFAGGDRGRPDPQRTPTITQKGMRSRSAEARHYHPRAFAVWGQDDSESENTASDDEK
jgi:NAD+ kinase